MFKYWYKLKDISFVVFGVSDCLVNVIDNGKNGFVRCEVVFIVGGY